MSVNVIDTIKPKNGGSFPVVEAVDVKVSDSQRLDAALAAKANTSDLATLSTTIASKADRAELVELRTVTALKANQSSLDATNVIVASKAPQSSLDALSVIVSNKADKADYSDIYAALDTKASTAELTSAVDTLDSNMTAADTNLQNQINQIEISASAEAVVAPEVAAARVGADGTSYETLKERLDTEITGIASGIADKANARELLDGYIYLTADDFTVGYLQISDGQESESIRGVYTDYLPANYVISVDSTAIKVAKYSYVYDDNKDFISANESVSLPNTTPSGYYTRYQIYWSDPGLYTNITEERALELIPHIAVRTATMSDYKGSNPNIENLDLRKTESATAYVVDKKISWKEESVCDLLIEDTIKLCIGTSTVTLSTTDLYALADASDIVTLRSDNSIRGYDFALVYDTVDSAFKFRNQSYPATYTGRYIILFAHFYSSLAANGLLVEPVLSPRIYALEHPTSDIPDYFITEATTTVASVAAAATEPCYAVIFVTDSHHNNTVEPNADVWAYTSKNIAYLNEIYQFDAIIHGGDMVSGNISKASTVRLINEMRNDLAAANDNVFILMGNHDDNSYKDKTTNYISPSERYGIMHRQSCAMVYTCPDDTASFYYDVPELGLRIICLNSIVGYGVDSNSTAWGYSDDTLAWFRDTALDTDNQVAIFSHMAFSGEFNDYSLYPKNGVAMRGAVDSFVANGGTVVALFHGHNHWDNIGQVSGSNLIEVDTACGLCSETTPTVTGATVPTRNRSDVTADCFDCIVIKPASKTVNMIRFGAGEDRTFTY